jgi:hypothetical protein
MAKTEVFFHQVYVLTGYVKSRLQQFSFEIFLLLRETKRNEIRFACISLLEVRENKYFFVSFCFQFFDSNEREQKRCFFLLCFLNKFNFCFLFSHFSSKEENFPNFLASYFPKNKVFTSSFESFRMFWLVSIPFCFEFQSFTLTWTVR